MDNRLTTSQENLTDSETVDFVSAVVHELKTSLTAIIASAEIIADELHLDEGSVHWKLIQSIIRNAHRLNERVTVFAQIPRSPTQGFEFRPEPVDIGPVIRNVVTRIHPGIQGRRQSLTVDIPDSLPQVRGDIQHLEQIVMMLLSNASKFSPDDGKITLSVRQQGNDKLVVCISDNCGGIPVEEQERIFKPYYQIAPGDDNGGLGLTIARFLVELHGGEIWLEGHTGAGCSFFFSLPIFRRQS